MGIIIWSGHLHKRAPGCRGCLLTSFTFSSNLLKDMSRFLDGLASPAPTLVGQLVGWLVSDHKLGIKLKVDWWSVTISDFHSVCRCYWVLVVHGMSYILWKLWPTAFTFQFIPLTHLLSFVSFTQTKKDIIHASHWPSCQVMYHQSRACILLTWQCSWKQREACKANTNISFLRCSFL